jgi:hypothetical protein
VDGTELSAEWAFSSLQKFGQEFLKKIKGKKMPNKLLEKVRKDFVLFLFIYNYNIAAVHCKNPESKSKKSTTKNAKTRRKHLATWREIFIDK